MYQMFYQSSLNIFPSSFDTRKVQNFESIFYMCNGLDGKITLGNNFTAESSSTLAKMFDSCSNISSIDLTDSFNTSTVENMNMMFNSCSSITSINFGSSFNTTKVTNMNGMFGGCKSLEAIDIANHIKTPEVTDMGNMFSHCEKLTELDLGENFNTSKVTNMSYMFKGSKNLKNIKFGPFFDTSSVTNMEAMFRECTNLNLVLPDTFNTKAVKNISFMFYEIYGTKNLVLPDKFDTGKVTTMEGIFSRIHCDTIKLPDSFTGYNVSNLKQMFYLANKTKFIYCNNNLYKQAGEKLTAIENAFYLCELLQGYDGSKISAEMAKPQSEGGYFTTYSDESLNKAGTNEQDNLSNLANNDEKELLGKDLENQAVEEIISNATENESTDDSKDIDDIAGAGVAGGAVIAPAVISQIMRRNRKNDEAETL